jgi:predicted transposase/invertase (TIGR01784 family)
MMVSKFRAGKAEGLSEGIKKGKAEVARALLKEGMTLQTVAKVTGMLIDDLRALHQSE